MQAELITIGDEILIGQIVDSNSAWMAQQVTEIGIEVKQITSISDQISAIKDALDLAFTRADIILMTGGLGPTKDDKTREALSDYFQSNLRRDEQVYQHVLSIFAANNRPLLAVNEQQADVLEIAEVLFNRSGTAPGMYIQSEGKHVFVLPGVPSEMMHLMSEQVIPRLSKIPSPYALIHRSILTAGIGESYLADRISSIENGLPETIQLAYLPAYGQVRLRLSGKGKDPKALAEQIEDMVGLIKKEVGEYCIAEGTLTLEEALIHYLKDHQLSLASAESCTGGNVAHRLTLVPGSSEVFLGGVVAYTNAVKESFLGVPKELIGDFGAVSEQTVKAMAEGIKNNMKSDYGIATTGIAGPGGGSETNPIGTVWIGIAGKTNTYAQRFQFDSIRSRTIERATMQTLVVLLKILYDENGR